MHLVIDLRPIFHLQNLTREWCRKYVLVDYKFCVDYFSNDLSKDFERDSFPRYLIFHLDQGLARELGDFSIPTLGSDEST